MFTKRLVLSGSIIVMLLLVACGGGSPPPDVEPGLPGEAPALPGNAASPTDSDDSLPPTLPPANSGFDAEAIATQSEAQATTPPVAGGFPTLPPGLTRRGGNQEEEAEDSEEEAEETDAEGEEVVLEITDAASFTTVWDEAYGLEPGTVFTVVITEAALEGYLDEQVGADSDAFMDFDVTLDETATVGFSLTIPGINVGVDATATFDIFVTEGGQLMVEAISATAGDQEIPADLLDILNARFVEAVTGDYDYTGNLSFTDVVVADGEIRATGVVE